MLSDPIEVMVKDLATVAVLFMVAAICLLLMGPGGSHDEDDD